MFYIKTLKVLSGTDTISEFPLSSGLNIVYGVSESGKSLIVDCLDFMFGGEDTILRNPKLGIKGISLTIDVDGKDVGLYRALGKNDMVVSGDVDFAGGYTAGKGSKKTPPINSFWLRLMGIDAPVKIYQFMNKSQQSLTVRTFIHTFLINETRLGSRNSILKSGEGYSKNIPVSTITSLLYLATEKNFIPDDEEDDTIGQEVFDAKKEATQKLVNLSMAALSEREFNALPEPKDKRSVPEIQKDIDELLGTIEAAEDQLSAALEENQKIGSAILNLDRKLSESRMLDNRYSSLRSQYESDIRRLTFIAEGEIHKETVQKIEHCPFCNGELPKEKTESCIDAAIAEVDKIKVQIADLQSAAVSLHEEMEVLKEKKSVLVERRKEVQATIRGELRPKVETLRDKMGDYTAALEHAKAKELMDSFVEILKEKMDVVMDEEEVDPENQFDVREKIRDYLKKQLEGRLKDILEKTNYRHFVGVIFDVDSCDVMVNGSIKMTHGQGFRAFINSVVAIALQEVLDRYNMHRLPLMVIDSPIMSLKEREENVGTEKTTDDMRSGLFQYLLDHSTDRQSIVIENTIPTGLDYKNANLLHFTKDENEGYYGLVKDYRD